MSTPRDAILKALATVRSTAMDQALGFRVYDVYIRRSTPDDGRGGRGAVWTVVDTPLVERPKVRVATQRDIAMSGGRIQEGDYLLSRITPEDTDRTVGVSFHAIDPSPAAPGQKVYFVLVGEGLPTYAAGPPPSGGGLFEIMGFDATRLLEYRVHLRPSVGLSR